MNSKGFVAAGPKSNPIVSIGVIANSRLASCDEDGLRMCQCGSSAIRLAEVGAQIGTMSSHSADDREW